MSHSALVELVLWLEEVLDALGVQRSYGGAIAYNYYGPLRFTHDVDILVLVPDLKLPSFLEELKARGCLHKRKEPEEIDLRAVLEDLRSKAKMTAFLWHDVPLDVFVPWHSFHHEVLRRSRERNFEERNIRIHAPEDLIVFKKIFDRPKDWQDIKAILMAQRGNLDTARLLADARQFLGDDSLRELEDLIRQYASA